MTLKEKFIRFTKKFSPNLGWRSDVEDATECEKIADDYAIEFAEWCFAKAMGLDSFKLNDNELKIFKKEKGL